jgi:hypothetical protein
MADYQEECCECTLDAAYRHATDCLEWFGQLFSSFDLRLYEGPGLSENEVKGFSYLSYLFQDWINAGALPEALSSVHTTPIERLGITSPSVHQLVKELVGNAILKVCQAVRPGSTRDFSPGWGCSNLPSLDYDELENADRRAVSEAVCFVYDSSGKRKPLTNGDFDWLTSALLQEHARAERLTLQRANDLAVPAAKTERGSGNRGKGKRFRVAVQGREDVMKRSEAEKPLAFISHDFRDKDSLVRELARELSRLMCPVWYDEYSLNVGDSLRASIEQGLKETKKCVVVLSPHFLSNDGWGRAEFDSVYTREILEKSNIILPVWHNVGVQEVYQYCPRLADKFSLSSSLGVPELARRLSNAIKQ